MHLQKKKIVRKIEQRKVWKLLPKLPRKPGPRCIISWELGFINAIIRVTRVPRAGDYETPDTPSEIRGGGRGGEYAEGFKAGLKRLHDAVGE